MKFSSILSTFTSAAVYCAGTMPFTLAPDKQDFLPLSDGDANHLTFWMTYLFATGVPSIILGDLIEQRYKSYATNGGGSSEATVSSSSMYGLTIGLISAAAIYYLSENIHNGDVAEVKKIYDATLQIK